MLTEEQYKDRKEILEGASMVTIWENIHPDSISGEITFSFNEEKELFLWFIERLMNDGKVKLASCGRFLTGSIKEKIDRFRINFPIKNPLSRVFCLLHQGLIAGSGFELRHVLRLENTHAQHGAIFTVNEELVDQLAFYLEAQLAVNVDCLRVLFVDDQIQLIQVQH